MAGVFGSFLEELEARTAIEDCLKRFARAVDRQDWKAAREGYHDGAWDDHGFFKGPPDAFLAHIEKLHAVQEHSMHFNTNVLIEFKSKDHAFVETYVLVLQRFDDRRATASARYLDRFEKRNGRWAVVPVASPVNPSTAARTSNPTAITQRTTETSDSRAARRPGTSFEGRPF